MNVKKKKSKNRNYVDNEKFLLALNEFKRDSEAARQKNEPRPQIPEYIGECILKIAQEYSLKSGFVKCASFRDDMVSDAVENSLKYIENFSDKISKNPFSYFTQIIYFAFLRKIQSEHDSLYLKFKTIEDLLLHQDNNQRSVPNQKYGTDQADLNMRKYIQEYEERREEKKRAKKDKKGVKNEHSILIFMEDEPQEVVSMVDFKKRWVQK